MAGTARSNKESDKRLVARHVDANFDRYGGRADARLLKSGVSVWAIVAFLPIYDNDRKQIAEHFDLSDEEVEGALAYYRLNKPYIDARILLNQA